MKPGNNIKTILVFLVFFFPSVLFAEEKITSTPLVNLDKIKPSFEETNEKNDKIIVKKKSKKKRKKSFGH